MHLARWSQVDLMDLLKPLKKWRLWWTRSNGCAASEAKLPQFIDFEGRPGSRASFQSEGLSVMGSIGSDFWRVQIEAIYRKRNPYKLWRVPEMLENWRGSLFDLKGLQHVAALQVFLMLFFQNLNCFASKSTVSSTSALTLTRIGCFKWLNASQTSHKLLFVMFFCYVS